MPPQQLGGTATHTAVIAEEAYLEDDNIAAVHHLNRALRKSERNQGEKNAERQRDGAK